MQEHKKVYLKMNGYQSLKLRSGSIIFENYFKQLAAPFQIYADFESVFVEFTAIIKVIILLIPKISGRYSSQFYLKSC